MTTEPSEKPNSASLTCGLIMPISAIDGLGSDHWAEVKSIIQDSVDSIDSPKFTAKLVSDADDVGVIHKRIVQGIYNSDIVVCDVSARNANVMFELGMRLAFDKPTVIIKDDKTDYAFDTSIIEHVAYPRDLRFSKITNFKRQLAEKIVATYKASENPSHSTFLKNFGTFKVAELNQKVGSGEQVIMEMLADIQQEVVRLRRINSPRIYTPKTQEGSDLILKEILDLQLKNPNIDLSAVEEIANKIESILPAHKYFRNRSDFLDAVKQICEKTDLA